MSKIEDTQPIEVLAGRTWSGTHWHYPYIENMCKEMRDLRAALKVLATELHGKALDRAVGKHWDAEINDAVWENPIAAAAVMEASK